MGDHGDQVTVVAMPTEERSVYSDTDASATNDPVMNVYESSLHTHTNSPLSQMSRRQSFSWDRPKSQQGVRSGMLARGLQLMLEHDLSEPCTVKSI